ncbi:MAG: hypothetical protein U0871_12000 [Gemmataceae bacterium]
MSTDATPAVTPAPTTDAARRRAYWMPPRRTAGQSFGSWLAGLAQLNRRPHVRRLREVVRRSDELERLTRAVLRRDGDALTADMRAELVRIYRAVRASALGTDLPPRAGEFLDLRAAAEAGATDAPR